MEKEKTSQPPPFREVSVSAPVKNTRRQIMTMLRKHKILTIRNKATIFWEILSPCVTGGVLYAITLAFRCKDCSEEEKAVTKIIQAIIMPVLITLYVPNISQISNRFIIQSLVEDKQNKMRETLRLMSLSQLSYALSFLLFQGVIAVMSGLIVGVILWKNENIFSEDTQSRSIQFILCMIVTYLGYIPFTMSLSTFFMDSKVANYVGGLIMTFPIIIFLQFVIMESNAKYCLYLFYLLPVMPSCGIFVKLTAISEKTLGWDVPDGVLLDTDFISAPVSWFFLFLCIPFWFLVYLYLDNVMPNDYGVQKPHCYCLKRKLKVTEHQALKDRGGIDPAVFDENDAIIIEQLVKKFGDFKAVDDLTISIKQDEIFTILGHNGAGKTTAINMLTGMLKPSSGEATIYGKKISQEMDSVQKNMGLCQQFDILYDKMTVAEHLRLVCDLKNTQDTEKLIMETLSVVMLTEFMDRRVEQLSGGMKRKLSLAMAIVTRPKVVILDEPTSGLDVESRRQTWELIKRIKMGRSIIMSSQHLEEADELADRICIMTKGKLLSLDTPEAIKKQFGVGYKILIEPKTDIIQTEEFLKLKESDFDPIILSPENQEKQIQENSDSTPKKLIYQVPFTEVQNISTLLKELEDKYSDKVYIDVEVNSLEDAYINIAREEEKLQNNNVLPEAEDQSKFDADLEKYMSIVAKPSICQQVFANAKRRLVQFLKQPQEQIINAQMIFFIIIQIFIIQTVLTLLFRMARLGGENPGEPLSEETERELKKAQMQILSGIFPTLMIISIAFSSALLVKTPVKDREDKLRYLLNFAGITPVSYYLGLFIADVILFIVPMCLIILLAVIFQLESFVKSAGSLLLALIVFGQAYVNFNYFISFLFSKTESAFKYHGLAIGLSFNLMTITNAIFASGNKDPDGSKQKIITKFYFWISPFDCFSELLGQALTEADPSNSEFYTKREEKGTVYMHLVIQSVFYFLLATLIDYLKCNSFKGKDFRKETQERKQLDENQDVLDHRAHVNSELNKDHLIWSKNLKKVYPNGVAAVNSNTFAVKKGEVFGLLGPNGAGKSSMFNVMTMDLKRTDGEVGILNTNLDQISVLKQGHEMGMCPQFNTIWDVLTVDQSINFIGQIKGLTKAEIQFQRELIKKTLDLLPYADVMAKNLSGGNKRKLICAMSLVACPKVEFLDEPTTGVDPVSRRSLFKMLKRLPNSSLVLTTHRMDEAESLCDNISIMINGRFVCYGSPGYLKSKYGQGYTITIDHKHTEDALKATLPSYMEMKGSVDQGEGMLRSTFQVQVGDVPLNQMFSELLNLKQIVSIQEFTLTRSSLETVFVEFAKHQIEQVDLKEINLK